jgi:hypothetical protein
VAELASELWQRFANEEPGADFTRIATWDSGR